MKGGYIGKIAFIDLTTEQIREQQITEEFARDYLGGYGFGVKILLENMMPGVNPLGTESVIGFITGVLTGTGVPTGSRYMIAFKSPLTNGWGDSNSGGYWGSELKKAGWDALFISGVALTPKFILVLDNKIVIKDACHLWGKDTIETEEVLRRDFGDSKLRVACIGPASENISLISGIYTDHRFAARAGGGAVMGSKRLKAIAVRGKNKIPIADKMKLTELNKKYASNLKEKEGFHKVLMKYGTCGATIHLVKGGATPVKNWSLSGEMAYPNLEKALDADEILKYQSKKVGCANCSIRCGGKLNVPKGQFDVGGEYKKPEYETIASFGPMCLMDNMIAIYKLNDMCDRSGLDTISAGSVLAFAMDCFENGIITKTDTGGIDLTWGNAEGMIAMIDQMIHRRGFGDVLADGVKVASEKIGKGAKEFAVHIRGQEPGYHSPLMLPLRSVGYLCDATPGRHTTSMYSRIEAFGDLGFAPYSEMHFSGFKRYEYKCKGPMSAIVSNYWQALTCSGLCLFGVGYNDFFPFLEYLEAVVGWKIELKEILETGRRIQTLRQLFNIREGNKPSEVTLPGRLSGKPPKLQGPVAGITIDEQSLVSEYWKAMGYDEKTGHPLDSTLEKLGLGEFAKNHYRDQ